GGAARAVVLALGHAGAAAVGVGGRDRHAAAACASLAGAVGSVVAPEDVRSAELLVDATGAGMRGDDLPFDLDPGWIHAGQLVVDLVYAPAVTPLLVAAADRGATARGGLGMLVHQAARQWTAWTGQAAPIGAMAATVGLAVPAR
ncbi:MAG: shikimate dehydrogenase family protein, partial [Acidimicrobiales bacterium]